MKHSKIFSYRRAFERYFATEGSIDSYINLLKESGKFKGYKVCYLDLRIPTVKEIYEEYIEPSPLW